MPTSKGRNKTRRPTTRQRDAQTRDKGATLDNYYPSNRGKALNPQTDKTAQTGSDEDRRLTYTISGAPVKNRRQQSDQIAIGSSRASLKKREGAPRLPADPKPAKPRARVKAITPKPKKKK